MRKLIPTAVLFAALCLAAPAGALDPTTGGSPAPPPPPPKIIASGEQSGEEGVPAGSDDTLSVASSRTYCKKGKHLFGYYTSPTGKVMSATLEVSNFCHRGNRVFNIGWWTDWHIYGAWTGLVRHDGESVDRHCYSYSREPGSCSGYAIKVKFHFSYCIEPTHSICPYRYTIFLREYVHSDGSWNWVISYP